MSGDKIQVGVIGVGRGNRFAQAATDAVGMELAALCRMDNGSVFRLCGPLRPGHSSWYRVHGARGAMEITRGGGDFWTNFHFANAIRSGESIWREMGCGGDDA